MKLYRTGASGTTIGLAVVLVVVVVGAGAYVALNPGRNTTTTLISTQVSTVTSTSVSTSTMTSVSTATSAYLPAATVNGGGGTLVYPLMSSWVFAFTQAQPSIQINYASIGSGAGIAQITAGTLNFGESDAPLKSTQYAALPSGSTLLTVPISGSAVVPAYNIPGLASTTHLNFTGNVLAEIFYGTITAWNDHRIAALNPKLTLPTNAITVIHRSDGSGTMYAFTNYLSDSNSTWKSKIGFATSVNWPAGIGCKGNEGVAGCIANTQYSVGALEIAYEITNKGLINYGAVQNHAGNFILANLTNIQHAVQAGAAAGLPVGNAQWTGFSIIDKIYNDTADHYVYPITTFTYALVYQDLSGSYAGTSQAQATATVYFLWWIVNSGQGGGGNIGYPPLPANVVSLDDTTLKSITYNGTPVYAGS
jgi:phosphate transport system substrate-binding protein